MAEEQGHGRTTAFEVASNVANESAKALAIAAGFDPMAASAIGGAAGGTVKSFQPAFDRLVERRRMRAEVAVGVALDAGGDLETILTAAMEDDRKLELLGRAMEVAQRTADLERVRFYARIAVEGVLANDQAQVDTADRVFTSVSSLDPSDLKVLLHMHGHSGWKKHYQKDKLRAVAVELPEVEPVLDAVFAKLERLGLINGQSESGMTFGSFWSLTEFGNLCVQELKRLGRE